MRTLIHLSDLHFGKLDPRTIEPLTAAIHRLQPNIIAVSGDLTQRARHEEFVAAKSFLDDLPSPQIVVPGNHDAPIFDPLERWNDPFGRFRKYIGGAEAPCFAERDIAIVGINSARPFSWLTKHKSQEHLEIIEREFKMVGTGATRIVVSHHPVVLPALASNVPPIVDIFLAGHFHHSVSEVHSRFGGPALYIRAGTATSSRTRGEPCSFNVIRIENPEAIVEVYGWDDSAGDFRMRETSTHRLTPRQ